MTINNFDLLRDYLDFPTHDIYYFLQIIKRRKDNPEMEKDAIVIDNIYISNITHFDNIQEEIISICDLHNARAYLRLNKRSYKKTAFQTLKRVTDLVISENYKAVKNAYSSISGEFHGDDDKKWIIDLDGFDNTKLGDSLQTHALYQKLKLLQKEANREPLMLVVPTKNGIHIITRPFNIKEFKESYKNIDIHKDNPTILYQK